MTRRVALAVACVALLAGAVYVAFFRPSDEERIRRKLVELADAVLITDASASSKLRAPRMNDAFSRIFAPRLAVDIDGVSEGSMRREQLAAEILAAEAPYRAASLDLTTIAVAIEDARRFARVTGKATALGVESDGQRRVEKRTFEMRFASTDGDWRIVAVSTAPLEGE